jgi:hypothetical protein
MIPSLLSPLVMLTGSLNEVNAYLKKSKSSNPATIDEKILAKLFSSEPFELEEMNKLPDISCLAELAAMNHKFLLAYRITLLNDTKLQTCKSMIPYLIVGKQPGRTTSTGKSQRYEHNSMQNYSLSSFDEGPLSSTQNDIQAAFESLNLPKLMNMRKQDVWWTGLIAVALVKKTLDIGKTYQSIGIKEYLTKMEIKNVEEVKIAFEIIENSDLSQFKGYKFEVLSDGKFVSFLKAPASVSENSSSM